MKRTCIVLMILTLFFTGTAFADAGPKPTLKIILKNVEGDSCIVDLLVEDTTNDTWESWTEYDGDFKDHYDIIMNYREDGWRAVQANGLYPVSGYPETKIESGKGVLNFGYHLPQSFKIIAVTSDGTVHVSNLVERKTFNSTVTYDLETGKAAEKPLWLLTLVMFLQMYITTLILEAFVLWIFRFWSKENRRVLLRINTYTQIGLALAISVSMYLMGILLALLTLLVCEVLIFIVEAIYFANHLQGHSKLRRVLFALSANTVSLLLGSFIVAVLSLVMEF